MHDKYFGPYLAYTYHFFIYSWFILHDAKDFITMPQFKDTVVKLQTYDW